MIIILLVLALLLCPAENKIHVQDNVTWNLENDVMTFHLHDYNMTLEQSHWSIMNPLLGSCPDKFETDWYPMWNGQAYEICNVERSYHVRILQ